jgi:predicted transposase/invertase (TIGR01784 family)
MFEGEDYHTEIVTAIKGTDKIYSDKFNMHFFELKKVNQKVNPNNRRELWMQFLNADSEEDFEMLKQTNVPIINKAVNVIYDLSEDTRIREAARIREKALHDEASALANAKNEGRAEGRAVERADTVMRMKSLGFTDEQIKAVFSDFSLWQE